MKYLKIYRSNFCTFLIRHIFYYSILWYITDKIFTYMVWSSWPLSRLWNSSLHPPLQFVLKILLDFVKYDCLFQCLNLKWPKCGEIAGTWFFWTKFNEKCPNSDLFGLKILSDNSKTRLIRHKMYLHHTHLAFHISHLIRRILSVL